MKRCNVRGTLELFFGLGLHCRDGLKAWASFLENVTGCDVI